LVEVLENMVLDVAGPVAQGLELRKPLGGLATPLRKADLQLAE